MRKIVTIIALLLAGFGYAQDSGKAKALLDEVYQKVKGYDNIYVDFKYALNNKAENIRQETRGDVTIQGNKYLFNYLGATKIFDGNKVVTIIPENEEVVIESPDVEEDNAITPSKMLTFYREGYNYSWDKQENVRGRQIQYIKLVPIDTNAEMKEILLGIDAQTKHIYDLIQTGKNGTKTTITVNSFKTDQPLSGNLFKFNAKKYEDEGYYIIEQ
ncbi:outer membrane lipoprotein carrier protein LolA [Sinomicrobium sp. FJxs]|uniref:Outer membrane lipoprotein carrier protein LolA n=1 Tax=Sinomicrobium weinanense TaxID=2842200 RepID=A0A926JNY8_9FLAO|nr:outer membrane lipoprotein carrier protein LolA [Sinomicrobium weinanense]MBU3125064.1 outer membrane lipoprotein carrier protein LolA [Sinomicrobium weinanense]